MRGNKKGLKIIVFEGLDKSGKHTISEMVVSYLKEQGYKVYKLEYPDYESIWGKKIRDMLKGEVPFDDEKFEEYQTNDKLKDIPLIKKLEQDGYDYLIFDRYVSTQVVYAKTKKNEKLNKWIELISAKLPKPTIEIFLDVKVSTSVSRRGQHGDNDKYEANIKYLEEVRSTYIETLSKKENSVILTDIDNVKPLDLFITVKETLEERGVI